MRTPITSEDSAALLARRGGPAAGLDGPSGCADIATAPLRPPRLCMEHMKAEELLLQDGSLARFCQK